MSSPRRTTTGGRCRRRAAASCIAGYGTAREARRHYLRLSGCRRSNGPRCSRSSSLRLSAGTRCPPGRPSGGSAENDTSGRTAATTSGTRDLGVGRGSAPGAPRATCGRPATTRSPRAPRPTTNTTAIAPTRSDVRCQSSGARSSWFQPRGFSVGGTDATSDHRRPVDGGSRVPTTRSRSRPSRRTTSRHVTANSLTSARRGSRAHIVGARCSSATASTRRSRCGGRGSST